MVDLDIGNLVDSLAQSFGDLFGQRQRTSAGDPFNGSIRDAGGDPFDGSVRQQGADPFSVTTGNTFGMSNPFGVNGTGSGVWESSFSPVIQAAFAESRRAQEAGKNPTPGWTGAGGGGNTGGSSFGGDPSTGMTPDVARWAAQTKSTFADIDGLDPDTMLAIMTNESGGDPNVQNHQGAPAYGLFQLWEQPGLTADQQFKAAHDLAVQKMQGINAAYAKNGLNPNAQQRAIDFALAWAGHFDYATGRANPSSVDNVSGGQTAADLTAVFLKNYNAIKGGRTQATSGAQAGSGTGSLTPDVAGSIMQEFGPTEYAQAHPSTYAYGNAYGLQGSQHPGVDWAVPMNSRVATPVGGVVSVVGNDHGSGYYYTNTMSQSDPDHSGEYAVTLDNGDILILGHMSNINVQVGQRVTAGQIIGMSGGSDGAHVHVEYRQRNANGGYTIVDPRSKIRF